MKCITGAAGCVGISGVHLVHAFYTYSQWYMYLCKLLTTSQLELYLWQEITHRQLIYC